MNIAIIGAGTGGTKLLNLFNAYENIEVVSVIDRDLQSPGILKAKAFGIHVASDVRDINPKADILVDATGSAKVIELLKETYGGKKRIVESDVAELMMLIVDKQIDMTSRLNHQLDEINRTSEKLHEEMNRIVDITSDLNTINSQLIQTSEASITYIEKSDEMIRAVNKITQQIKILGLNANIEAARAGEHGRGFSVVATEVQKMSDNTSDFAAQISELLKSLRTENETIAGEVHKLNTISESQHKITNTAKQIVDNLKNL